MFVELLFLAVVAATFAMLAWGLGKRAATGIAIWLAFTGAVAATGVFRDFSTRPPRMTLLLAPALLLSFWIGLGRVGKAMALETPATWVIGMQAFRIAVELFLYAGAREGFVPTQMSVEGRNWDVLTGLTALPMAYAVSRDLVGKTGILIWNLAGLGLLFNVLTIAILSMPTPLRRLFEEPANRFVAEWPYVWLPAFLVPLALTGHVISIRQLKAGT